MCICPAWCTQCGKLTCTHCFCCLQPPDTPWHKNKVVLLPLESNQEAEIADDSQHRQSGSIDVQGSKEASRTRVSGYCVAGQLRVCQVTISSDAECTHS